MSRFEIILFLILILVIGAYKLLVKRKRLIERDKFSFEFMTKLSQYVNSRGKEKEVYGWLIHNSVKMQNHMGQFGIIEFKPPAANYLIRNYQLIINGIPALPRAFAEEQFFTTISLANQYASILAEALIRYHGVLDERLEGVSKELKNPFKIFREGVQTILSLPLYLLEWLGLGGNTIINSNFGGLFIRLLTGIVSFIAFISAVVSLVVGWENFITITEKYLHF